MRFLMSCIACVLVAAGATTTSAQCLVDDEDFATADGGCKDLNTGLVWSPDLRAFGGIGNVGVSGTVAQDVCDQYLNDVDFGGFSDWRLHTVGEAEEAIANGLNSHLDFFLDGSPDDGRYRWTSCLTKVKGRHDRNAIRYSDGDIFLAILGADYVQVICVRGVAEPEDCFAPSGTEDGNGNGNGGGKGGGKDKNAMLLPRSATGALLLTPLWMMALVWGVKRHS